MQLETLYEDRHKTLDEATTESLKNGAIQLQFGILNGTPRNAYFTVQSLIGTTVFRELCIIPDKYAMQTGSDTADLARAKKWLIIARIATRKQSIMYLGQREYLSGS
jgi:hypothetical protein